MGNFFNTREKKLNELLRFDITATCTNYNKSNIKRLKLSLIIIELLAYFTSKQPFTDLTT